MDQTLSTPLAAQVGAITAAIRAEANQRAAQAGVIAALHALIFAAFARMVAGLEKLIQLWQSGLLPQASATAPRHSPPSAATTPHAHNGVSGPSGLRASAPATTQPAATQPSASPDGHARRAAASSAVGLFPRAAAPRHAYAPGPQAPVDSHTAVTRTGEGFVAILVLCASLLNRAQNVTI